MNFAKNKNQNKMSTVLSCAASSAAKTTNESNSESMEPPTLSVTLGLRCKPYRATMG